MGVPDHPGEREIGGSTPPPSKTCNCKLQPNRQSYAATWRIIATTIPHLAKLLWSLLKTHALFVFTILLLGKATRYTGDEGVIELRPVRCCWGCLQL